MSKEYVQNLIYRDPLHSFQLLPSYFYILEKENLRIMTKLKTDDENRFEYLFLAFCSWINDFRSCCKSTIAFDETHLNGKFWDVMFVIGTNDDNEQIYPFTFGFNNRENDQS